MKKYIKQIQELESKVGKQMGNLLQITLDLVQNTEFDLNKDNVSKDDIGSKLYEIDVLLEAFNPVYVLDIEIIKELQVILTEWNEYKPQEPNKQFANK